MDAEDMKLLSSKVDPSNMSLGELVKDIVRMECAIYTYSSEVALQKRHGKEPSGEDNAIIDTIRNRHLPKLYAELDRREKLYGKK